MKKAIMFSGQGAQITGMGREVYERSEAAREIFDIAGEDIKKLCFEGPDEELGKTINTQPCLFTVTMAEYAAYIHEENEDISAVCGFSLGEYSAMCAAGVFDFATGLELVQKRAKFMEDATTKTSGGMTAVLGVDKFQIRDIIVETRSRAEQAEGILEAVNYNCAGQIVVAGEKPLLENLAEVCAEKGVKARALTVSGAFHSSLMQEVIGKLEAEFEKIDFKAPQIPIVSNVTGRYYEVDNMKEVLAKQVASAVLWEDSIKFLKEMGIEEFKEVGVGKTLEGFLRRIG
ncbi:malonyl CoA-acyl carrier protein transacylase [Clostridia bacterium]|nr:malonyl CoA-acyl carrier protein transacylase [Clostridia bacterium]